MKRRARMKPFKKTMWALLIGRGCVTYPDRDSASRSQDAYFTKARLVRVAVQEIKERSRGR